LKFVKENKPEAAIVEEIKIEEYSGKVRDVEKFRASFNTIQLSKIVQIGLKMVEKQDKMPEKQDKTLPAIREVKEEEKKCLQNLTGLMSCWRRNRDSIAISSWYSKWIGFPLYKYF